MDSNSVGNQLSIMNYYVSNGIIIFLSLAGIITIRFVFDD